MDRCTSRARLHVFWPQMNGQIDDAVCQRHSRIQTEESMIQHEVSAGSWQKIGSDLLKYQPRTDYLVVVD